MIKQKCYWRIVTTDLWDGGGGRGRNKQKRHKQNLPIIYRLLSLLALLLLLLLLFIVDFFETPCTWNSLSCSMDLSKLFISLSCYMDVIELINGFFYVVTQICQKWYMDFSNLLHGLVKVVKVVIWICQIYSMYLFLPFAKQDQAEVWPRF